MTELQAPLPQITQEQLDIVQKRYPMLQLACRFLLWTRKDETPLRAMVEGLIAERHSKYHNSEIAWWTCGNQICVNAKILLDDEKKQQIEISNLAIQIMNQYDIRFDAVGDKETGTLVSIKMQLVEKQKNIVDPTQQPQSGLILP